MTQRIQAVAFDLDGLMFNTEMVYDRVGEIMLERRGKTLDPEVVAKMMGRQSQIALQIMIDSYGLGDTVPQLEEEAEELFLGLIVDLAAPMPGLMELLDQLEMLQIPKAITTSSRWKAVEPLLKMANLEDRFAFRLTAEDVTNSKPDPEIYLKATAKFHVAAEQLLVLEDSMVGCQAAVAAGATVVAVPSKYIDHHDFSGAEAVVESLETREIYALVEQGRV
ncbi:MAG: HAD family phosphatase [Planctomycetota bacterium]